MKSLFLFVAMLASASLATAADCGCASCPGACDCGCQFVLADAKAPAVGELKHEPDGSASILCADGSRYLLTAELAKDAGLVKVLRERAKNPPLFRDCPGGNCAPPAREPRADTAIPGGAVEALAEVNALRARSGLPPFAYDEGLTTAAARCAADRAAMLCAGHTQNDFAYLPPGAHADSAGCAAWEPGLGWGSCCSHDAYRVAGAAYAVGRDGRRYMSLFVRR